MKPINFKWTGDHLSHSAFKRYKECHYKFYAHASGLSALPTPEANTGRDRHKEIAECLSEGNIESLGKLGKWIANQRRLHGYTGTDSKYEEGFSMPFFGTLIVGQVDYNAVAPRLIHIVDFKSFPGVDDAEQLLTYACGLRAAGKRRPIYLCQNYFYGPEFPSTPVEYTNEDLDLHEEMLAKRVADIMSRDEWAPNPDQHCKRCGYTNSCPAGAEYDFAPVVTEEQALAAAAAICVIDAKVAQVKKTLKQYMTDNGISEMKIGSGRVYLYPSLALKIGKATKKKGTDEEDE